MNEINRINDANTLIQSNQMMLLYISSEACGICKIIQPKLQEMLLHYPAVSAYKIDIDKMPEASGLFQVFTLPCVLFFAEGKELIREARYIHVDQLQDQIQRYYEMLLF